MATFIEQHAHEILGTLSCFDRVVISGTLPDICPAHAMAGYLSSRSTRLFDYPRWAGPLRDELRGHAEQLAGAHGLTIEVDPIAFRQLARQVDTAGPRAPPSAGRDP